jgi:hypothetical protein
MHCTVLMQQVAAAVAATAAAFEAMQGRQQSCGKICVACAALSIALRL